MTRGSETQATRILVVEDSVDSAETLAALLQHWGHEVRLAHDGEGALRVAREFRPQIVLLDIGLPDVDGYTVAHHLRAEDLAEVLIALTGYGEPQDRARAQQAGFDRHLTKPVEPDALQKALAGEVSTETGAA